MDRSAAGRARSIAVVAALIGGIGWLSKLVIMWIQGGPDEDSVPESIAFFVGLLGVMVAAASVGSYLARRRPIAMRVLAALGAVVGLAVVNIVGQVALEALPGDAWIQSEAIFGVIGLVAVVLALRARGTSSTHATSHDG